MGLKKDKEKVLDEVWTEERVKAFLTIQPAAGVNADFHVLQKAYQSMRLENFDQFLDFFDQAGRDINATGPGGKTILSALENYQQAEPYREALISHGAS